MKLNKIIYLIFLIITSCKSINDYKRDVVVGEIKFSNKGFALVYDNSENITNIVSKKIDERSLIVFQKNLKKGSTVKITNLLNGKSIIGKIGSSSIYPNFYNSVVSKRISLEIELDENEPYVEIYSIGSNSSFVAKKAKTFDEEKVVADKAPVEGISIDDLNSSSLEKKVEKQSINKTPVKFNYIIKIADFYFESSAKAMKKRISKELKIENTKISKLSTNSYRVFIGPFKNIKDLKIAYNTVSQLEFENIEIIKK